MRDPYENRMRAAKEAYGQEFLGSVPGGPPAVLTDEIISRERVQWYSTTMTLPVEVGADVQTDIQITQLRFFGFLALWDQTYPCEQNQEEPFIKPCLINQRDGLFRVEFRTSARNYSNQPAMIRTVFGDAVGGRPIPFSRVLVCEPKETIVLRIINMIDRTGTTAEQRVLDITFMGVNQYGLAVPSVE